jgi:DNA-binding XRE family transcriptional regulator
MNAKIEKRMKKLGLNKVKLAKKAGLSVTTINKILNEKSIDNCIVGNAKKVAKALECNLCDIVYGNGKEETIFFVEEEVPMKIVEYCVKRKISISELETELDNKIKKINDVAVLLKDVPSYCNMVVDVNNKMSNKIRKLEDLLYKRKE